MLPLCGEKINLRWGRRGYLHTHTHTEHLWKDTDKTSNHSCLSGGDTGEVRNIPFTLCLKKKGGSITSSNKSVLLSKSYAAST